MLRKTAKPEKLPYQMKRKKSIRRVSKKRAKLNALLNPGRVGFLLLVDKCMVCDEAEACDVHEICRGSSREKCLLHPRLWLALCRDCHRFMEDYSKWPIEKQIAVRIQWEIKQTIFEANEIRGRAQTAIQYHEVAEFL